ncbi:hypothetical protein GIS00_18490 [Nakamurella sp. YIM 132087]|uniref:Uncharacterized protein n=1 Tax=Nakamurella alba TaxID=2665158 RepID=A0A7K1FP59_9ACTN|nr:hypothetical protein [Nakamurella alba]MTD15927.1 hypothetical protein [Nakamurella alba]
MKKFPSLTTPALLVALICALIVGAGMTASAASDRTAAAPAATVTPAVFEPQVRALPAKADHVFVPLAPCRIVDTRVNSTPLGSEVARNYYVGGTFGFAPQGGKSGGCGVPTTAVAVSAIVTAVDPSNRGFLRAWPTNQSEPASTLLNYGTISTGTGATVPIAITSGPALRVKNYAGPTDLVIEVNGYYEMQIQAQVEPNGILLDSTYRFLSSSKLATGTYRITVDTNITACAIQAQSTVFSYYTSVGTVSGSTFDIYVWRIVNGINTLTDGRFLVTVTC